MRKAIPLSSAGKQNVKYVCKGDFFVKNTVLTLQQAKKENKKITMLTAYDYSTARLMDEAGVNMLLVGDSLGNVVLGSCMTRSSTRAD